ncbi:MAG TPA: recombination protein O N-terminal domain-containing protein [Candidatus Paceibacterota bacterium]
MAHHTYSTESLILGSTELGESNRFLSIFTHDLGLIRAVGKNLRGENSKLRYHLQNYSFAHISLVRGRDVWRITGAHASHSFYTTLYGSREKQLVSIRICALLARLLQGEEPDFELFNIVSHGMIFLEQTRLDTELLRDFEYIFVIRILARLGYVGDQGEFAPLFNPSLFSIKLLDFIAPRRSNALALINRALDASGL